MTATLTRRRAFAPDDFMPLLDRDNHALINLLGTICAFDREHEGEEWRTALVRSLSAVQFNEVWAWARELHYAIEFPKTALVRSSRLAPPAVLAHLLDPEVASIDVMLESHTVFREQLRP